MLFQSQANTLNPFLKMKLSPVSWIPQSHLLQLIMLQVTILSSLYCLIHCATNFFHNFTWVYECPYFVAVCWEKSWERGISLSGLILWFFDDIVHFSSVAQSCPTLCDSMNCSMPGFPLHHQLPESTQTHVHRLGDAIQPSHPLSSPSPPALNLSQHQGLFKWPSNDVLCIRWPKYWSCSFNISPSQVK